MKKKKRTIYTLMFLLIAGIVIWRLSALPFPGKGLNKNVPMPNGLHPVVEENSRILVQQAAQKGILIELTEEFRSIEEQDHIYAKGRTSDGSIVTYARGGESYHNFGLAVDFALKDKNGGLSWDMKRDMNGNSKPDWMEVVSIAKDLGFEWGGDWVNFKDYPHLQMSYGLSIAELQQGERPPGDLSGKNLTIDK